MKRILKKKLNNEGFSISEMLIAIAIMLMVTSVVAGGIPVAIRAYTNITDTADCELLLSTALSDLRDELSTARNISVNGNKISYIDSKTKTRCYLTSSSEGGIKKTVVGAEGSSNLVASEKLLDGIHLEYTIADSGYTDGQEYLTFTSVNVYRKDSSTDTDVLVSSVAPYSVWIIMD